ncbi:MAG: sugar transferase [Rikenellaceae bacterium]|nr:sugar transferase [Rikenellaceae bacterium]
MQPVVYIGRDAKLIDHFSQILECRMIVAPDVYEADRMLHNFRNGTVVVLYEKHLPKTDAPAIRSLHKLSPPPYVMLVTGNLADDERALYLKAGVNNAIAADADKKTLYRALRFVTDNEAAIYAAAHTDELPVATFRFPLGKRVFDIVASSLALLLLSPLLLITAAAIRIESKGPILYKSKRVGTNYQVFDFFKFRSMYVDADKHLHSMRDLNQYGVPETGEARQPEQEAPAGDDPVLLVSDDFVIPEKQYNSAVTEEKKNAFVKFENDPRITRVGQFIRKYSIDELPQLFNILRGDMSVVGNRPLPLYEAERLTNDEYIDRFMCPAGLTGLWQVEKRGQGGSLSAEERKQLDIRYAKNYSLGLDMQILLKTFIAFIQKENV